VGFERVSPDPAFDQARDCEIRGHRISNITSFGNPGERDGHRGRRSRLFAVIDCCDHVVGGTAPRSKAIPHQRDHPGLGGAPGFGAGACAALQARI
jgi:hypothetical protein